jgi:tRNA(Ile)-lysidine synthase
MNMIVEKFKKSIIERRTIEKGDSIVIAISGGPDSVAMTSLLLTIKEEYNLKLFGVHLDHLTRDGKSTEDAKYVKKFLKRNNIESYIFTKDVSKMAEKLNISFEEAGRLERYRIFKKVMDETNSNKVALGQNLNDQGETLLFRLFRGTGLDGLTGIEYVREDNIIRPILDLSRKEIEKYCEENSLVTRRDYTNFEPIYSRNKIRLKILPYVKEEFNSKIDETLWRTANILREDKLLIDSIVNDYFEKYVNIYENCYNIEIAKFNLQFNALKSRLIRKIIFVMNDSIEGLTYSHINEILELVKSKNTGKFKIIKGIKFRVNYNQLSIFKNDNIILNDNKKLITKLVENIKDIEFSTDRNDIYIDYDKVIGEIYVRNRKAGDRFIPFGMKGSKKIKDFFIDEKIDVNLRNKILLVCDKENIIWVVGYRMNNDYRITKITKKALHLSYE